MRFKFLSKCLTCLSVTFFVSLASVSSVSAGTVYELYELVEGAPSESGYLPSYDPAAMFDIEESGQENDSSQVSDETLISDGNVQEMPNAQAGTDAFSDGGSPGDADIFDDGGAGQTDPGQNVQVFSDDTSADDDVSLFSDQSEDTDNSSMFYAVSSYRLSDEGISTGVKNQGSLNVCWAFSTLESIETGMMKRGLAGAGVDLSETHLVYSTFHGKNSNTLDGTREETFVPITTSGTVTRWTQGSGNHFYSTATLARGYGVAESSDYPLSLLFDADVIDGEGSTSSILDNLIDKNVSKARLKNCYWLPEVNYQPLLNGPVEFRPEKIKIIKYFIKNFGGVEVGVKANGTPDPYDSATNSIYNPDPVTPDHSVTLIGWDDNKETAADKPGAFLMQNSWGSGRGENGLFWISYYDRSLKQPSFYEMEDEPLGQAQDVVISQYDGTGYASVIKPKNPSSDLRISGANVFTSPVNQYLDQVSFYAAAFPLSYEISVYRNVDTSPDTGVLVYKQTGSLSYAGYFTIDLAKSIPIAQGEKFAVEVKFDDQNGYVPHERVSSNSSSRIYTADYGQSYLYDGENWSDMMDLDYHCNICIKGIGTATTDAIEPIQTQPSKPAISSVKISNGNQAVVNVKEDTAHVDGYDFVIGTSKDFLTTKDYAQVKKNIANSRVTFSYIPKGTYYVAVHSFKRDGDGTKIFSSWSDIYTLKIQGTTPGKVKIQNCRTGKGTLNLSYSKAANAYRYEYVLSKKSFGSSTFNPSARMKTLTGRPYEKISLKNIPKGTYYFGIRAYTLGEGNTKVYGKWTVKKVNIQ